MSADPLIRARGLELSYAGGAVALAGVEMDLTPGAIVILLGPNGGGKTTLLRAFAGELAPSDGSLHVATRLAYLPQRDSSRVDFPVSALDVVLMGTLSERGLWRRPTRGDRSRALAALERVGLEQAADETYGHLSGGQRRRVLLARTIVGDAQIVALDEPLAGVDPRSGEVIRETLASLRDEGRLVIEASHDIAHARMADRVICLSGRVVADGPPAEALTEEALRETYAGELALVGTEGGLMASAESCRHDERPL